jgi:hypothetical protein
MPRPNRRFRALPASAALLAFAALQLPSFGQNVISVMGGFIHHVEGEVFLENRPLQQTPAEFLHVLDGQRLRTADGRAELLLTPGGFLRLGPHSEIEMIAAGLGRARLRVTGGSAIVELLSVYDKDSLAVLAGDGEVRFPKAGLYRVNATGPPATLQVIRGKAVVLSGDSKRDLKGKQELALSGIDSAAVVKFDPKQKDPLDEWNQTRADTLAKSARNSKADDARMDRLYREWIDMTLRGPGQTRTSRMPESRPPDPQPRQAPPNPAPQGR